MAGILIAAVAAAGILFGYVQSVPPASYIHDGSFQYDEAVAYWQAAILKIGPDKAYDAMVRAGKSFGPSPNQHTLAHSFGEALYRTGGTSYVSYCKNGDFLYGCYHQFIGLALEEHGVAAMKGLKAACESGTSSTGACAHGIGHALLTAQGYSFTGLQEALQICATTYDESGNRGICADGVFMEYNLENITTLTGTQSTRQYADDAGYGICTRIDRQFANECMYELPLWWRIAVFASTTPLPERFKGMGAMCLASGAAYTKLIPACFLGVGYIAAEQSSFSVESIKILCAAAGGANAKAEVECLAGAGKRYYENGLRYQTVCAEFGLTDEAKQYCETVVFSSRQVMFATQAPDL